MTTTLARPGRPLTTAARALGHSRDIRDLPGDQPHDHRERHGAGSRRNRDLVFGVSSLLVGQCLERCLVAAGFDATVDIGRQGWPASVWVAAPADHRPFDAAWVTHLVTSMDPRACRVLHQLRKGPSVRVTAYTAAATSSAPRGLSVDAEAREEQG